MKPQTVLSRPESEPHSTAFNQPGVVTSTDPHVAEILDLVIPETPAELPDGFTRIGEYVAQLEARPDDAAEIRAARERLAAQFQREGRSTLRSMRLALGLSQAQLAARVGTSQPQIARIESGMHDPNYGTFERLARALEVSNVEVFRAFEESRRAEAPEE